MDTLRNFMRGRYGADQLNIALMICGLVLSFFFRFFLTNIPLIYLITYVPFCFAVFRLLSRNIPKRAAENVKFSNHWYRIKTQVQSKIGKNKRNNAYPPPPSSRKTPPHSHPYTKGSPPSSAQTPPPAYAFVKCPHCGQPIRLPKGKRLQVSCPACKATFQQRT